MTNSRHGRQQRFADRPYYRREENTNYRDQHGNRNQYEDVYDTDDYDDKDADERSFQNQYYNDRDDDNYYGYSENDYYSPRAYEETGNNNYRSYPGRPFRSRLGFGSLSSQKIRRQGLGRQSQRNEKDRYPYYNENDYRNEAYRTGVSSRAKYGNNRSGNLSYQSDDWDAYNRPGELNKRRGYSDYDMWENDRPQRKKKLYSNYASQGIKTGNSAAWRYSANTRPERRVNENRRRNIWEYSN